MGVKPKKKLYLCTEMPLGILMRERSFCQVWQTAFLGYFGYSPKNYHAKISPILIKEKR